MNGNAVAASVVSLVLSLSVSAQQPDSGSSYRITGRVVMADGSPMPESTSVELICNGQMRKRVRPFTNGDFSVILGEDASEGMDIVTSRGPAGGSTIPFSSGRDTKPGGEDAGRFDFGACELRAALPGHESNVIGLGPRRRLDRSEVGQLVLRPSGGLPLSRTTLAAPAKARTAFDTALKLFNQENFPAAARELEKAVGEHPTFASAWSLLGRTRIALKDAPGAREAFAKSIAADPNHVEPYIELATISVQQEQWAESVKWLDQAQRLSPDIPYVHYLNAFANFQLHQVDAAEKSALVVLRSPDLEFYPLIHYILGGVKAQRGDFESAANWFRQFLETSPDPATAQSVREVLSDWEREGRIIKVP